MYTQTASLSTDVEKARSKETTPGAIVNETCDRIDDVDVHVEAFLDEPGRRVRLSAEAAVLEEKSAGDTELPPLYGALIGVKDIFHVDGFTTRAGSQIPPELFAGDEAVCVQQLRAAGALIAGKTVTTEFAYFEPGPTRNPHNLEHTPGGSSSGSAAAVAAGLCTLALGTQTIGSVIRPAAYCGVVGFKPTYDRIASAGLVYFSRTVDHVGLFTQDVASMQLAASVLCRDWGAEAPSEEKPILAIPEGAYLQQADEEGLAHFEATVEKLIAAGYTVKRLPLFENIDELNQLHSDLAFAEFAQEHETIYAEHAALYRPRTAAIIERGQQVRVDDLDVFRSHCAKLRKDLRQLMNAESIDLWICPPAPGPAPEGIAATGSPMMNLPWTHTGMPAVTIPAGKAESGLPLGLQLVGHFGADERVLGWAREMEGL